MLKNEIFIFYITSTILLVTIIICNRLLIKEKLKTDFVSVSFTIVGTTIMVLNNLYMNSLFKSVIGYLLIVITIRIIYKKKLKDSILDFFPIWIIINILDTIIPVSFSMLGIIKEGISPQNIYIIKIILSVIEPLILFMIILIPSIRKIIIELKVLLFKMNNAFVFLVLFLIINLLGTYSFIEIYNSVDNILVFGIMALLIILIFYLINLKNDEKSLENKNKYLSDANAFYNKLVIEYQTLQHNINNQFLAIKVIANDEVKELIEKNIKELQIKTGYLPFFQKAPKAIREVFFTKFADIDHSKNCIHLINDCPEDIIEKIPTDIFFNLLEAIAIVIDNAIEADYYGEKIINIEINSDDKFFCFCITNTFNSNIDVDKIGQLNYTTKSQGHGIGLNYLHNNQRIDFKNKILNNKFQSIITVKIKN